jgi:hypothetical protein
MIINYACRALVGVALVLEGYENYVNIALCMQKLWNMF